MQNRGEDSRRKRGKRNETRLLYLCTGYEKTFKMEPAVEKLEALFQKSEADLDYIEKRLKLEFINTASASGCTAQESPMATLKQLTAIKARHAALRGQLQELASEHTHTMDSIRANMEQAVEVLSQLQDAAQIKELQDAALPGKSS